MADSSGEEEEYEYEEVEVEEEVEEEEEEEEEIEEIEEEVEEDEEIVEEEEEIPEDEQIQEEEEEEEYEEVEEEVEEEEEEEEEEYEEIEEEVEEEVEVSDEDEEMTAAAAEESAVVEEDSAAAIDIKIAMEAVAESKRKAIEEEEKAVALDEEMAVEAVVEANAKAEVEEEKEAIDDSGVGSSDLRVPVADQSPCDVRLDKESKRNDVCSRSKLGDTVNSEVVAPLDDSQQNRKGKNVLSLNDGSVNLPERLNSVANPRKIGDDAVTSEQGAVVISPLVATVENQKSHVIHMTPAVISEEHVSTPDSIHDKHCKIEANDVNYKWDPAETSLLAASVKNQQSHDIRVTPAVTSMEHVSTSDGNHDKLCKSETTDIDEMRFPSQREDLHLPPSERMDQMAARYHTPQLRPRSSSPGGETDISSKRPAMICEFFAKGWCIKGSSCRFLHKRDQVDHSRGQVEGNKLSTKVEAGPSKDSGDASGASMSRAHNQPKYLRTDSDDLLPISTAGMSAEKDHREPVRDKDDFRLLERDGLYRRLSSTSQRSPSSKDGSKLASSPNEAVMDMRNGNRSYDDLDHRGSSVSFGRSALPDNVTPVRGFLQRGYGVDSDAQMNSLHPYAIVEESIALRRQYTLDLHSSPVCEFPSRSSNYFRNSSLSDNSSLKDMLISYKKRRFTPYNWEPSVPFRPSSFINSKAASSAEVPYDPLRDSIEQPNIGHDPFRRCSYQHAQSVSRRNSLESPKRLQGDSNDKNCYSHDKDTRVVEVEAESAAISATNAVNNIMTDENNPVVAASVKDVLKSTKSISDGSSKLNIGGPRNNGEIGRQTNNGLDEEKTRVIKIFRAALIEFVKELMKPVWHEGRLSKDVYKVIVQKAEDKILSTLPSNEVPNTPESIKQYLSSSRPNILKLIQAYVDKYGKF